MDVTQLFNLLAFRPDVKVIKPWLPNMVGSLLEQTRSLKTAPLLAQNASGECQLEGLHRERKSVPIGFARQQMNMLGHDHKAENHEALAAAGLFKNI